MRNSSKKSFENVHLDGKIYDFTCHTMKFHNRLHTDVQANLGFTSELESKYNHLQFLEKNFKSYKNLLLIQFTTSVGTCGMLFSSYYEKKKVSGFRFLLLQTILECLISTYLKLKCMENDQLHLHTSIQAKFNQTWVLFTIEILGLS